MRAAVVLAFIISCTESAPPPSAEVVESPRVASVVLITVDTLRADYVGVLGGSKTPVMDDLAERGWLFERCYATSMLTNPSHASMMTSLYPRDHGVYDNESGIGDGVRTLAMAMEKLGKRTAAVIGFPHLNPGVVNLGAGFEKIIRATRDERRADETSKQALAILDELAPDDSFFLWVHYVDPHAPYEPLELPPTRGNTPMRVAASVAPGFQRNNPWFRKAFREVPTIETMIARYAAEVWATDRGLGILIDGLQERGRLSTTAIVLTSDHGENLGEHNLYFHHGGLYRESIWVPLIISVPNAVPTRISQQVSTVDIAPTILELVDGFRWEPMRGDSLVSVANGLAPGREFVFSEHMLAQQVAVRGHQGTAIEHQKSTRQFPSYRFVEGKRELYDRHIDPTENQTISANTPLARRLATALAGYLGAGLQLAARPAQQQDRESLRALGYIE